MGADITPGIVSDWSRLENCVFRVKICESCENPPNKLKICEINFCLILQNRKMIADKIKDIKTKKKETRRILKIDLPRIIRIRILPQIETKRMIANRKENINSIHIFFKPENLKTIFFTKN